MHEHRVEHVMREVCPRCRQYDCPSLRGCETPEATFKRRLDAFISAGHALVEAWFSDGFNADAVYDTPVGADGKPLLDWSLDEWLLEFAAYYDLAIARVTGEEE
jgi:hypothetical protein